MLIAAAAFVIVVAGLRAAQTILVPFLLSAFIAVISAPPLFWLQRRRVPMPIALLVIVAGLVAIGMLFGMLVGTSIEDFSNALPTYRTRLTEYTTTLLAWLKAWGFDIPEKTLLRSFNPAAVMGIAASTLSGFGAVLTNAFLILLTVIFILFEASSLPSKLRSTLVNPEVSLADLEAIATHIQGYIAIKTVTSLITGVAIAVWLAIIGVDYPLLWGVLAFLLNYVPNIGSIIAAVPAVLVALIQGGEGSALLAIVGYVVVNVVVGNALEPRLMGRGLGLSTLVVFLSLVFWGWVLGPVGMLLSVPLTVTLKIALASNQDTRWIAVLLGSKADLSYTVATPVLPTEGADTECQEKDQ